MAAPGLDLIMLPDQRYEDSTAIFSDIDPKKRKQLDSGFGDTETSSPTSKPGGAKELSKIFSVQDSPGFPGIERPDQGSRRRSQTGGGRIEDERGDFGSSQGHFSELGSGTRRGASTGLCSCSWRLSTPRARRMKEWPSDHRSGT